MQSPPCSEAAVLIIAGMTTELFGSENGGEIAIGRASGFERVTMNLCAAAGLFHIAASVFVIVWEVDIQLDRQYSTLTMGEGMQNPKN